MAPFTKPEAVLKQAEGLVSVGQTHAALQSLTEMFTSKRFRSTPLTALEPILLRFVELCVDMRKGRTAKEGLMQYKNIAQNTSVASIEVVIQRFLALADAKVQQAQEKADKAVAVDVDDLEASETPESILLGAVSGDQSKDRTDRALVTPWLKFLWESYRTSLETLKNNARLEVIYQQVAQQAFRFCLKHQRKVEFRRLCETLRLHLSNVAKYAHQAHSINLSDPEILQHHLDTRFAQLNTSVELELWQEAFRSVEDIHNLFTMAKKAPRPAMMANYYEKLTKIFLTSGNSLYHAAAWGRYYAVVTSIGGKSDEEMSRLAGQVLVSALAVPVGQHGDEDDGRSKSTRLTALLGLSKAPTRAGLLKDALSRDVLRLSPTPIKTLYNLLEASFDPLTLCASTAPILATLCASDTPTRLPPPSLTRPPLSTIKVGTLLDLVKPSMTLAQNKSRPTSWAAPRRGELRIRVDHATETISFIDEPFSPPDEYNAAGPSTSSLRDTTIQPSSTELVRSRLSTLATVLHNALCVIDPVPFAELVVAANAERRALSLRKALVARRRELLSELSVRKERGGIPSCPSSTRRQEAYRGAKRKEDAKKKEIERARREIETIRRRGQETRSGSHEAWRAQGDMEDLSKDRLMRLQVEQLEKEKKDLNERLRIAAKRIDHTERAYRKEERPLLTQDYADQQAADPRIENSLMAHNLGLASKKRLSRMQDDFGTSGTLLAARTEEYQRQKASAAKKIEEEKEKQRKAYAAQQEAERKEREEAEAAARKAEEERLRAEAEQRAAEEAEAAKKRQDEEHIAEQRQQRELERAAALEEARKKAQREQEAEERARMRSQARTTPAAETGWRRACAAAGATAYAKSGTPKIGGATGGWRERLAAKQAGQHTAATSSPATTNVALPESRNNTDGFETVPEKKVWRPKRVQNQA
ncbi:hypothetical protein L210DRAFT_3614485 [Boletus edulis BED1]|uniref:Eukaryotic translation initiation factor 3 subunit A n=1 Tax=Boletus edulis BED1 TaxID=1328754 RepID=A0AAD4BI87_BOLED|nr:hypothetical protein L210DRAFT_3614485 [Boletus edulis BED1]